MKASLSGLYDDVVRYCNALQFNVIVGLGGVVERDARPPICQFTTGFATNPSVSQNIRLNFCLLNFCLLKTKLLSPQNHNPLIFSANPCVLKTSLVCTQKKASLHSKQGLFSLRRSLVFKPTELCCFCRIIKILLRKRTFFN